MASAALLLPTTITTHPAKTYCALNPLLRLKPSIHPLHPPSSCGRQSLRIHALQKTKEDAAGKPPPSSSSAEEVTKKYGLELGLWKIFTSKEGKGTEEEGSKTDRAKELLTKYGGAYLATSITLSLISFSLCYLLVSAGIDVKSLLDKVGIVTDETGGKVGTFALAYAAHKAASPIRFPPTVALTPIVAGWIGKITSKTSEDN